MTDRSGRMRQLLVGITLQNVRDWMLRFNAEGPSGLINCKPPGQPRRLTQAHRTVFAARVEQGPDRAVDGVERWRFFDVCQWALSGAPGDGGVTDDVSRTAVDGDCREFRVHAGGFA